METITREVIRIDDMHLAARPVARALNESAITNLIKEELKKIQDEAHKKIDDLFARVGVNFVRNVSGPDTRTSVSISFQNVVPSEG